MKKTILFILTLTLLSCGRQYEKTTETSSDQLKDSIVQGGKLYTVTKEENEPDETTDTTFAVGKDNFKVTIKNYTKGDFTISDTSENQITLFKENFIDIKINDKTITIDKSLFSYIYPDKNQLYHSCFGKAFIEKIDKTNKKIIFITFFGYHQSDFGEMLYYSISFDGKFEFIKTETPNEVA